jgi:hypothetical protein
VFGEGPPPPPSSPMSEEELVQATLEKLLDPINFWPVGHKFGCAAHNHYMCEAVEDIYRGCYPWLHKLGNWVVIPNPTIGGEWPKCPQCGSYLKLW